VILPNTTIEDIRFPSTTTDDSLLNNKNSFMRNLLYIVAFVFIIGWLVGSPGVHAGGAFHLLLVVAIISTLLSLMQKKTAL
jgi:hypothetical protein